MKKIILGLALTTFVFSCATPEDSSSGSKAPGKKTKDSLTTAFVFARQESSLLGRPFAPDNAKSLARRKADDKAGMSEAILVKALVDKDLDELLQNTSKLAQLELQQSSSGKIDDKIKLALAVAALLQKRWGYFSLWVEDLMAAKDSSVKALAYNLKGLALADDGRMPEAIEAWKTGLRTDANCEACALNYAFAVLAGGDYEEAMQAFAKMKGDWLAQSGNVTAQKFAGKKAEVSALCKNLTETHQDHAAILYNCGVFEWDVGGNKQRALQLLRSSLDVAPKGPTQAWQKEARAILDSIPRASEKPKA